MSLKKLTNKSRKINDTKVKKKKEIIYKFYFFNFIYEKKMFSDYTKVILKFQDLSLKSKYKKLECNQIRKFLLNNIYLNS